VIPVPFFDGKKWVSEEEKKHGKIGRYKNEKPACLRADLCMQLVSAEYF